MQETLSRAFQLETRTSGNGQIVASLASDHEADALLTSMPDRMRVDLERPDGAIVSAVRAEDFVELLLGARPSQAAGILPPELAPVVEWCARMALALAVVGLGSLAREAEADEKRTAEHKAARAAIASWEVGT
jgi:hypothetical protein